MAKKILKFLSFAITTVIFISCGNNNENNVQNVTDVVDSTPVKNLTIKDRLNEYANVELNADLSSLSEKDKQVVELLIKACSTMDDIFWKQAYGDKDTLFKKLQSEDETTLCKINFGPWDRLDNNKPFIENIGKKPIGSGFYPTDIKYLPFIDMKFEDKLSMFTVIKRSEDGSLYTQPYHVAYKKELEIAADYLKKAAKIAENKDFAKFLNLRAAALLTDNYYESDINWMDLNNSNLDIVIGPVESEEDRFIDTKTAYEAFLLLKDFDWSKKLEIYTQNLDEIKNKLNLSDNYKNQILFTKANIGVFDAIYYGGWANSGAKMISINHPKDGRILMEKGSRKLQFKNAMRAKFDKILEPISKILISENQKTNIKFDAFFINNLVYEIAAASVVKTTINNKGPVKDALKDYFPTINSLKADILNLYILTKLQEMGVIKEVTLADNYTIFLANVLRSIRFGSSISQGSSTLICFNILQEMQAIQRDNKNGTYSVNLDKMKPAVEELTIKVLKILAEGDYNSAKDIIENKGNMQPILQKDLSRISEAGIPIDIKFEQGTKVLGLTK